MIRFLATNVEIEIIRVIDKHNFVAKYGKYSIISCNRKEINIKK
jgi:hypothetical protein